MTNFVKSSRKVGRPSLREQLEIQNKLQPYFDHGLSAITTAKKTGISIKTAEKYFRLWTDELRENHSEKLVERQKNSRVRLLHGIDNILFDITAQHNRINRAILAHDEDYEQNKYTKEGKIIPYKPNLILEDRLSAVIKMKLDIYDMQASIMAAPTIDEQTEKSRLNRFREDRDLN